MEVVDIHGDIKNPVLSVCFCRGSFELELVLADITLQEIHLVVDLDPLTHHDPAEVLHAGVKSRRRAWMEDLVEFQEHYWQDLEEVEIQD